MRKLLGYGLLFLIGFGIVGLFLAENKTPSTPVAAASSPAKPDATVTTKVAAAEPVEKPAKGDPACMKKWLAAEKAGITYGEGMYQGHLSVMVDEFTFNSIDFAAKTGMAETLQCATVGYDHALSEVYFLSNKTGKTLAIWRMDHLEVQ